MPVDVVSAAAVRRSATTLHTVPKGIDTGAGPSRLRKTMSAPQVISKGADLLAMKIREIATDHGVPVVQSPMLARALFAHAEIDQPIPSSLYTAVAQVLAYVYRLKAALRGEAPMPQGVPDPFVPPELDPLNKKPAAAGDDTE